MPDTSFYVYIYLNPLKPGKYTYGNFISFQFEPFYIGKGKKDRIYIHLKEKKKSHKFYIIQKIRKNNQEPIIEKLNFDLDDTNSKELEIFYIKIIGRSDLKLGPLTNQTDGGEGKNRVLCSGETRKKLSKNFKGKHHSVETKKKISEAKKCKKQSEEHKRKNSEAHKGNTNGRGNIGRKHTEETKKKIGNANRNKEEGELPLP